MIRLKTAGCLQKQMRVNSYTHRHSSVPSLGTEPATCCSPEKSCCKAFTSKRCSETHTKLFRFFCGVPAARERLLVQIRCFCARPSRVQVNACSRKCYSRQTIRMRLLSWSLLSHGEGKSESGVFGFKIFMNLWIPLKDYNLSSISRCHTALGDAKQPALMCKGRRQGKKL